MPVMPGRQADVPCAFRWLNIKPPPKHLKPKLCPCIPDRSKDGAAVPIPGSGCVPSLWALWRGEGEPKISLALRPQPAAANPVYVYHHLPQLRHLHRGRPHLPQAQGPQRREKEGEGIHFFFTKCWKWVKSESCSMYCMSYGIISVGFSFSVHGRVVYTFAVMCFYSWN